MLDRLVEHLRARDVAADGQERPAAILWTDPKAEWRPLLELMQARIEELLVLGNYRPEARSGPVVWIIPNPVALAELAVDKQASTLLMPVASRRALNVRGHGRHQVRLTRA